VLTPAELCLLAEEIQRLALPARLEKIHQPRPDRLVLRLSREGEERHLLIATARGFARAHLVDSPPANPRTPPPFCEEARRLLQPGRILRASTRPRDAVLVLECEVRTDGGAVVARRLIAELFGSHPNVLIVSAGGTIEAVLVPRESRSRKLFAGEAYEEPPPPARELAPKPPFSEIALQGPSGPAPAWSRLLEAAITPLEARTWLAAARDALLGELSQQEKKLRRRLENIDADVRGTEAIPRLRREGELLKAHLSAMKRGQKEIVAIGWEGDREEEVRIALDPRRTPQQEVAFRFDEARRLERLKEAAAARRGEVEDRLDAIARLAGRARDAVDEDAIADLRAGAGVEKRPQAPPGRRPKVEPRKPYRTFVSKDGIEMLVGRTASDNDELTFRIANGNDWWFHVRDYPGSHVVIRARDDLPEQTLLDAATLAVHFSRGASGGKRDVSWTRRKFVSKARGAPPGQVLLSSHKTIHLRPEPDRLARLLKGGREG
jgi:predicted ribosome quality control (RQC) complex YloA/Tae2 family protein